MTMTSATISNPITGAPIKTFTHYSNINTADRDSQRFLNVEAGEATLLSLTDIKRIWNHPDSGEYVGNLYALAGQQVVKVVAKGAGPSEYSHDGLAESHVVLVVCNALGAETESFAGEFYVQIDGNA
jgi:hypothetical protein